MDSPTIVQWIIDMFPDWEREIKKYFEDDVEDQLKNKLRSLAAEYENEHPPTNSAQRNFLNIVQDYINDIDSDPVNNPFFTGLNAEVSRRERQAKTRELEAERETERIQGELQRIELRAEQAAKEDGYVVKREPGSSIIAPVVREGESESSTKARLEQIEIQTYNAASRERLNKLERTKEVIGRTLAEKYPEETASEIRSIMNDLEGARDVKDIYEDIVPRLANLPRPAKESLIRIVKARTEELSGVRQGVRAGFRRRAF